jgi:hypothetical protein
LENSHRRSGKLLSAIIFLTLRPRHHSQDLPDHAWQVVSSQVRLKFIPLLRIGRQDPSGSATGFPASLNITRCVADHPARGEIQRMVFRGLQQQARFWLPA